ncbi:MAG: hypothetical protein HQ539_02830 [Parcubacteria group bacterium]|nr:hypothetical protein [Parcubacteria group bacterium]
MDENEAVKAIGEKLKTLGISVIDSRDSCIAIIHKPTTQEGSSFRISAFGSQECINNINAVLPSEQRPLFLDGKAENG